MKHIFSVLILLLFSLTTYAAEKKEVCKDVTDKAGKVVKNKDGTVKQKCKTIKVHKKLEGTPIPEKKK
jgi:hypothetical protein